MLTGNKDIDREILLKLSDEDLITFYSLNKYFYEDVCDNLFFKRKLQQSYPETLKFYNEDNYKKYYLKVVHCIFEMIFKYKYLYTSGDPVKQLNIFDNLYFEEETIYNELLSESCRQGDLTLVKEALDKGADINDNALDNACFYGYVEIVKYLVEHGVNIHSTYEYALCIASENGHLEVVKYLIEIQKSTQDIEHFEEEFRLAFDTACMAGQLELVKYFIENGINLKENGIDGLCGACQKGQLEIIKYLLEKGVDIHDVNDCALREAIESKQLEVTKYLLEKGATLYDEFIDLACKNKDLQIIDCLIELSTDVINSLCYSSERGLLDIVKYLVEKYHPPLESALSSAGVENQVEIMKYLISQGADIHWNNDYALYMACWVGNLEAFKYLVEHGADISIYDYGCLNIAIKQDHTEIVKYWNSLSSEIK